MITAILVDGGFYRKRAYAAFGDKSPKERADELYSYCKRHLKEKNMIMISLNMLIYNRTLTIE